MIDVYLQQGAKVIAIKINGNNVYVGVAEGGSVIYKSLEIGLIKQTPIASIVGVFPDLKDKPLEEIKSKATKRYMALVNSMDTEEEIKEYLIADCTRYGMKIVVPAIRFRELFFGVNPPRGITQTNEIGAKKG